MGATVVPMPILPNAVNVPPMLTLPDMEAAPTSSKDTSGDEVLMPTLLLVVSTLKTLVSMVRSPVVDRAPDNEASPNVEAPVMVNVEAESLSGFNVIGPMPLVLVGGNWNEVGVILWNDVKSLLNKFILCSRSRMADTSVP